MKKKKRRRIEVDGILFSRLIPFCAEVMNKFKVGADGRTAYERITEHKCKHVIIGFAEAVDFILETDKGNRHIRFMSSAVFCSSATFGGRRSTEGALETRSTSTARSVAGPRSSPTNPIAPTSERSATTTTS